MVEFKNKIVWITGASSGIGESLAEVFARQGARVIISSHEAEELARVKEKLKPISEDIHTLVFNLANAKEVEAAAAKVLKEFGGVDVLMNNGGISQRALAAESPLEVDRLVMEVDYFAGVILAKAVLPGMIERRESAQSDGSRSGKRHHTRKMCPKDGPHNEEWPPRCPHRRLRTHNGVYL
jgi:NAD(P)-dependent dehydrogenase (short-subunit alcohol dehydrogenase family)